MSWKISFAATVLIALLSACNGQASISKGIKKDFNTGLTATYSNMEPGNVSLVMNGEVLNHTDIPLGESFFIINDKVKGLVVKEGKVSVGCSLLIKEKNGTVLLKEDDLFKAHDILDKDSANFLRCIVYTGAPMKWEEKYDVTVIFWDKYGEGKIENQVTIRSIDMP